MSQTIICEYLAEWDETEKQPNPADHGFACLYSMLEECQNVMFALGESANDKTRELAKANSRIAELERQLALRMGVVRKEHRQIDAVLQAERAGNHLWA